MFASLRKPESAGKATEIDLDYRRIGRWVILILNFFRMIVMKKQVRQVFFPEALRWIRAHELYARLQCFRLLFWAIRDHIPFLLGSFMPAIPATIFAVSS